jgi:hypothetical protein
MQEGVQSSCYMLLVVDGQRTVVLEGYIVGEPSEA